MYKERELNPQKVSRKDFSTVQFFFFFVEVPSGFSSSSRKILQGEECIVRVSEDKKKRVTGTLGRHYKQVTSSNLSRQIRYTPLPQESSKSRERRWVSPEGFG